MWNVKYGWSNYNLPFIKKETSRLEFHKGIKDEKLIKKLIIKIRTFLLKIVIENIQLSNKSKRCINEEWQIKRKINNRSNNNIKQSSIKNQC